MDSNSSVTVPRHGTQKGGVGLVFNIFMGMVLSLNLLVVLIYIDDKMNLRDLLIMQGIILVFILMALWFRVHMTQDQKISISYGEINHLIKKKVINKFYRDDVKYIVAYRLQVGGKHIRTAVIPFEEAFKDPPGAMYSHMIIVSKANPTQGSLPVVITRANNSKDYITFQASEAVKGPLIQFYQDKIMTMEQPTGFLPHIESAENSTGDE